MKPVETTPGLSALPPQALTIDFRLLKESKQGRKPPGTQVGQALRVHVTLPREKSSHWYCASSRQEVVEAKVRREAFQFLSFFPVKLTFFFAVLFNLETDAQPRTSWSRRKL